MLAYDNAVSELLKLGHELAHTPSHKFDLAHMRVLLAALGHPERRFPSVLIAGTNGKGSTAATLASILRAAGYRTALYTSPHLIRLNERIRIDGEEIADPEFAAIHGRVEELANRLIAAGELPWHPSFFEMLTAIAFEHFAQANVDIAVLEVGMGGRLWRPCWIASARSCATPPPPSQVRSPPFPKTLGRGFRRKRGFLPRRLREFAPLDGSWTRPSARPPAAGARHADLHLRCGAGPRQY